MKIDGKALVFRTPTAWPGRRRLRFLRKGNSVHLLETALVVEGYQQRFGFPVLDCLFRQALSEWTTVTIPYSRILDYAYRARFWWRAVGVPLLWLPVLALALNGLFDPRHTVENRIGVLTFTTGLAVAMAVITYFLLTEALAPRNVLVYQQADGQRAILVFSIRSKPRQEAFRRQLEVNREASRARVAQVEDTEDVVSPMPYLLLLLFLAGRDVVPGLFEWAKPGQSFLPTLGEAGLNALVVAALAPLLVAPRNLVLRGAAAGLLLLKALWVALKPLPPGLPPPNEGEAVLGTAFYVILAMAVAFLPLARARRRKP
jgi:hypothetical protein